MSAGIAALILYESGHQFTSTWVLIPFCILCYDHLLTLDTEINFVWKRPKRLSFFLFYYPPIYCSYEQHWCHTFNFLKKGLTIVQNVLVGYMFGLRVYAMYNFSWKIVLFLCVAASTTIGLAAWSTASETIITINVPSGCDLPISTQSAHRMAAAWESQFLCDVSIFVFTVWRSFQQPFKISGSIMTYMARDGTLYFAAMALVNLVNILNFYLGDVTPFIHATIVRTKDKPTAVDRRKPVVVYIDLIHDVDASLDAQFAQAGGCWHPH
ncbi:hypothetical protein MSAN_01643700 [Mycena sanguinolenta]|uniref:DUF6533 domain-containing protein n=1 Tax=Mycena sanguinolenta TaxID=230812 RepID=A0A8H6Y1R5_9AGAR|nr:hypothetical protein MSAN_01643700 [Mycena sanguinolenta]